MIDKVLRIPKEQVLAPLARRLPDAVHPTVVTGTAIVAGLAASAATTQQWFGWSIAFYSLYKLFRLVYPYPTLSGAIQKIADQYVR